jgi:hypothetical protein
VIGFVYILVNQYMPDLYKVGCTERSPHERAAELSKPSGVPTPFTVLCYIEVPDFQVVERKLHQHLSNFRVSNQREFFEGGLGHAVGWLWWHRDRLAFCDVGVNQEGGSSLLWSGELAGEYASLFELPNPWTPAQPAVAEHAVIEAAEAVEL